MEVPSGHCEALDQEIRLQAASKEKEERQMKKYLTKAFWNDAAERTISAVAQSLLLFLTGDQLGDVVPNVQIQVDWSQWQTWVSIAASAAIIQMLKNFVAVGINPNTGASFGTAVPLGQAAAIVNLNTPNHEVISPKTEDPVSVVRKPNPPNWGFLR